MKLLRKKAAKYLSIVLMLVLLITSVQPTLVSAAGVFTVPVNAQDLANHLIEANSNITITGSAITIGALSASSKFTDLNLGTMKEQEYSLSNGILVTTGTGIPPSTNTSGSYSGRNNTPGDADVESMAGVENSIDAFSLQFSFTVPKGITAVEFAFMFGSDEFPEYLDDIVDGAAVIVDGVNYAKFPGDVPLKVVSAAKLNPNNGLAIEYDGISAPQKMVALLDTNRDIHTIKIVIADTQDVSYDTGLFLSAMKPSTATKGGIVEPSVEVPEVISVGVTPEKDSVKQGESMQMMAKVVAIHGAGQTVTWSSNDESEKVTVDENGLVNVAADAAPGDYIITATSTADETKKGTGIITVTKAPETAIVHSVTVTPSSVSVESGNTKQLIAEVSATEGTDQTVTWSSNDESGKVTVDQNGLVSVAVDAVLGSYTITATSVADATKSDSATIIVESGVENTPTPTENPPTPTENPPTPTENPSTPTENPPTPTENPPAPTNYPPAPTNNPPAPTSNPTAPTDIPPVDAKTITVIEAPKGISNADRIKVTSIGDAFDKSVEVRLKDDPIVEGQIRGALKQIELIGTVEDALIYPLDISLYLKGTNTKVQPKDGTAVSIICPIPDSLKDQKEKIVVVCIVNGKLTILPTAIVNENGVECAQFIASHFSPYGFVVDTDGKLSALTADGKDYQFEDDSQSDENNNENGVESTETGTTKDQTKTNTKGNETKDNTSQQNETDESKNSKGNQGDVLSNQEDQLDASPKTGDNSIPMLPVALVGIISLGSVLYIEVFRRKKKSL